MNFGTSSTTGTSDRLLCPPLRPIHGDERANRGINHNTFSSLSRETAFSTLSQIPAFCQRRKRVYTDFQWEKWSGRSRHGAPERATQSIVFNMIQLSKAGCPPCGFRSGGNRSRTRCHWSL